MLSQLRKVCVLLIVVSLSRPSTAQRKIELTIDLPKAHLVKGIYPELAIPLKGCNNLPEVYQLANGEKEFLRSVCDGDTMRLFLPIKNGKCDYKLIADLPTSKRSKQGECLETEQWLILSRGSFPLIYYNHATMPAPSGVDEAYGRSGFIHPLRTLAGDTLTQIQPSDHYHHYGLWNPWTHMLFEGDTIDCWNLVKREGTVRFKKIKSKSSEVLKDGFTVIHEHVKTKHSREVVMFEEEQRVTLLNTPDNNAYMFDVDITYRCRTSSPVTLLTYRYGGLGFRATERWNDTNSEILTSEGKQRAEADGTLARWCIIQGEFADRRGGILILSSPKNYNHPEPLRVWPASSENHGAVFVNFSPTKNTDWVLHPGKEYHLRYRFVIFNGTMNADLANAHWQVFAKRPSVVVR